MRNDVALTICVLLLSSLCAILPLHAQFVPAAVMEGEGFTARSAPATVSRDPAEALKKQGYALIGDISLKEADGKPCWGENCSASLSCPADRRKEDVTDKLLKQAAAHGGDVVILSKDTTTFKDPLDKKGKCIAREPFPRTVQVMKCQGARRESTGTYNPGTCNFEPKTITAYECTRWETISGAQCSVASVGAVWRLEPDLPKRIAERAKAATAKFYTEYPGGMKPVHQNDKWGYENESGKTVVQPQFDGAYPFAEGLAAVRIGDRWGYIDKNGKIVVQPQFGTVDPFRDGLARVITDRKYGVIDKTGTLIVRQEFDEILSFFGGVAAARIGDRWGYIDKNGQYIVKPQFYGAGWFSEGLAAVHIDEGDSWGYIDRTGKLVIQPSFSDARHFSGGLAAVQMKVPIKSGLFKGSELHYWGYINKNGIVVIEPTFDYAYPFSEDLAAVGVKFRWGYINKTGEFVIKPQYESAGSFVDGKAQARLAGKAVVIDKSGRVVD